jgi:hypothetical protein
MIDLSTLASVASAFFAVASAVAGAYFARRSLLYARRATQLQYFSELRAWAGGAVGALSRTVHLCELNPNEREAGEFARKRHKLRCRLSALLDRGRWFFPNVSQEEQGDEKGEAFRGHRHGIVQMLYRAYRLAGRINCRARDGNDALRGQLQEYQRSFVGEMMKVLDPRTLDAEFRQIVRREA